MIIEAFSSRHALVFQFAVVEIVVFISHCPDTLFPRLGILRLIVRAIFVMCSC